MITRACISINNRCNLNCLYCHFHEKKEYIRKAKMDVFQILDNIKRHIEIHNLSLFKLGFVGNGEPLLDYPKLKEYILYISDYLKKGKIAAYTISNGLLIDSDKLEFFKENNVNVSFSIDGIKEIHDKYRCGSYDRVIKGIELFKSINGKYPSMNCTVGKEVIEYAEATITFFEQFNNRITFSRMIGKYGISMNEFQHFLENARLRLDVRTGGYDCTMYGGLCGAGIENIFYANGKIYICGNCVDLDYYMPSDTPLDDVHFEVEAFDRHGCFKEVSEK
ncbi:MAG: radical SAM protein [Lachnospiraceae bacterium]|nr:radical SAM protein [Lachnospiraceae bacterium]